MVRNDIRNQYGAIIGYSKEDVSRIEYYLLTGGMIGYWNKHSKRYIVVGKGGSGMKSQSDIGTGEVYRLATTAGKVSDTHKSIGVKNGGIMKYTLKQKVRGGYRKTEYEIEAKALSKLIKYAKKINAELFDESGTTVALDEIATKEQLLIASINSEWDTIKSYESLLDLFAADEQTIINDIIKEEKVHIGQFQAILDSIGKPTTELIAEGTEEGESQLGDGVEADGLNQVYEDEIELMASSHGGSSIRSRKGHDDGTITVFVDGTKYSVRQTIDGIYEFSTSRGDWEADTPNEVAEKILQDDKGISNPVSLENWMWEHLGRRAWRIVTDMESANKDKVFTAEEITQQCRNNASRKISAKKTRVKCSISELIEQDILSEDKAKEAYALGFNDALEKVDDIESVEGVEPNFDPSMEIEYDENDADGIEQVIYDAGVAEVDGYSDKNKEFDGDIFDESDTNSDDDNEKEENDDE